MLLYLFANPSFAGFRDPTQPVYPPNTAIDSSPDTVDTVVAEPRLSGIWLTARSKWATINGTQARQGQTIDGNIKILKIRKNSVTINQNGTAKTLQLIKRPYKNR
jgi:hypothetical protein